MWNKIATAGDNFITEFTTEKQAVVRSKLLRVPELVISILLLSVVTGYNIITNLAFLVEVPVQSYVRITHKESFTDFWGCSSPTGGCKIELPDKADIDFCKSKQWVNMWNEENKSADVIQMNVSKDNCTYFDPRLHLRQYPGSMMLATTAITKRQKKDHRGIWQGFHQPDMISFVIGGMDQMVRIEGSVGGVSLDNIAGFMHFKNENATRRIFCARAANWTKCPTEHVDYFRRMYGDDYPDWEPTMNSTMEECAFSSSGILCPAHVLLKAAGVEIDGAQSADGKPQPTRRFKGASISLLLDVINADSADYWSGWDWGAKTKFVIRSVMNDVGSNPMFVTCTDDEKNEKGFLSRDMVYVDKMEMYGLHLVLKHSVKFKEFSQSYFISGLLLLGVMMRYADLIVSKGLVKLYRFFGYGHVSMLYEYNVMSYSAHEDQILECKTPEHLQKVHDEVNSRRFKEKFETLLDPPVLDPLALAE